MTHDYAHWLPNMMELILEEYVTNKKIHRLLFRLHRFFLLVWEIGEATYTYLNLTQPKESKNLSLLLEQSAAKTQSICIFEQTDSFNWPVCWSFHFIKMSSLSSKSIHRISFWIPLLWKSTFSQAGIFFQFHSTVKSQNDKFFLPRIFTFLPQPMFEKLFLMEFF